MKVERDYLWKRYTFIPASKEDEKFLDVFNKYIDELEEENRKLKEYKSQRTRKIERENKKLKEENKLLKRCLDKLMFDADVINVKIHLESWDYCYVRSDKKFKLNVKD